jgi:hypothetical protein
VSQIEVRNHNEGISSPNIFVISNKKMRRQSDYPTEAINKDIEKELSKFYLVEHQTTLQNKMKKANNNGHVVGYTTGQVNTKPI